MTRTASDPRDTGTSELSKRRQVQPRLNQQNKLDLYVVDGSGPDKLLLEGRISVNEHATLLSFTIILHKARMLGPKSPALERVSSSDPVHMSTRMSHALMQVSSILKRLDQKIGRDKRMLLVDLCMQDSEWPASIQPAHCIAGLRDALDYAYRGEGDL